MAWKNNLRLTRLNLYRLKRQLGVAISVWQPLINTRDVKTGNITRDYTVTFIRRGIVMPSKVIRDFVYDLSYIAANKNFTYGGYFDIDERLVILDIKDLPKGFELTQGDHLIWDNRRYEVKEFAEAEQDQGYLIKVKMLFASDNENVNYVISGDGGPNPPNGNFYDNGVLNNDTSYQRLDGRYWLWWNGSDWIISQEKGIIGIFSWNKGDATITGTYLPNGTGTGNPIVT